MTGYKDLSPRGGVAYDVFGNGKTAVKVNFGKYLEPTSNNNNYILSNPITPHRDDDGARVDRFQQQLRAGLQPAQSGGAESDGVRRRYLRRR